MLPKITDTNPEAEKIQVLLIPNLAKPELKRDKFMMCSGSARLSNFPLFLLNKRIAKL